MPESVERSWIVGLPKAEIHLHLEGCIPPEVLRRAVARRPADRATGADTTVVGARTGPITNLPQLLSYLDWSCGLIDRVDDLAAIAYGAARRATASGVRHIDAIVNPTHWPHWHGRLDAMVDALDEGFRAAETEGFATAVLCLSLKRTQEPSEAMDLVDWILAGRHPRVAALSIDGDETNGSRTNRFVDAFAKAAAGGLRRCAHAGESSGPDGVREAIELLGVERIDHGVRAVEDPALVADLARRSIPLDICPTSNVVLGIVPDLAHHPVDILRRHGVRISLNTDDPLLYDVDVAREYELCALTFSWARSDVVAMARTSIESCFAPEGRRRELLRELDAFVGRRRG